MRILITSIFALLLLSGCTKNQDQQESEPAEVQSRFSQFLGTWQLESQIIDGYSYPVEGEIMIIEEDDDLTDSHAIGYYEVSGSETREEIKVELTENENEIIIKRSNVIFTCTYTFLDDNHFELDDSDETYTVIATWGR